MAARIYPITATIRPFLTTGGHTDAEIERIHQTWFKSVTLQLALGVRPYASDGNWWAPPSSRVGLRVRTAGGAIESDHEATSVRFAMMRGAAPGTQATTA